MSIESGTKLGDEEGMGGVVTPSHLTGGVVVPSPMAIVSTARSSSQLVQEHLPRLPDGWNRFEVKSDRRGVASWGLI